MSATQDPSDVNARLARLSDGQRVLLEKRLLEQRVAIAAASQIPRRDVLSPVPLSYSQELLWLLSQLEARGVAYNAPAAFRLHGPIDAGALQSALDGIVARHEILRTTYELVDDRPMQIVSPSGSVELRLVDLSDLQEEEQEAELLKLLHAESEYPFDLRVDSIIRPFLIRMGPDDHVFFNVMHHVATDGWSRAVLHGDLTELYEAALEQREPQLPPLKIQYADYAAWHRRWLDDGVLEQQLGHWKETLRGAPSRLELPTDRARPAVRAYEGDHTSRMISMEVRRRLEEIARAGDGTLFMSLLTAFSVLLHRYSGQDDIVIGTPFAGRHRSELESMIGYFINPLALRIDASDDPSFTELLSRARETTLSAFAHADVPYEMVVRATTPERDLSQTPVFQVMMVLHNPEWERKRPKFEPKGVTATELVHEKGWAKFDLLLGMSQRAGGAQHDVGVQHRALRPRDRCPHRAPFREAARLDRLRPRAADLTPAHAARRRAERDSLPLVEGAGRVSQRAARQGPVRGVGLSHAHRRRGRHRGRAVDVRGARHPGEPACPQAAEPWRRPGKARRDLHDEVARPRGRRARRDQGGRGLRASRPDVSGGPHRLHARGRAPRRPRHGRRPAAGGGARRDRRRRTGTASTTSPRPLWRPSRRPTTSPT